MTNDAGPPQQELPGLPKASSAASRAKAAVTRERRIVEAEAAAELPIARVLVDVGLAHLDRIFDYVVPATMDADARPGVRVKVRFAGKDADGFLLERVAASDHTGRLQNLRRVVSAEPVLAPEISALAASLAERYAGTRTDVLRLAVPPRHAGVEKEEPLAAVPVSTDPAAAAAAWAQHEHGEAFLRRLGAGAAPRAVWNPPPGADWPTLLAHAALTAPGGVVLCLPDHKDVARVSAALTAVAGPDSHVALTADAGPARRYRAFLAVSRGARRIVVGTRAAAFAPVHDLALVAIWDDGDDLHAEPRAPYPHSREVLLLRAEASGAAALVGGTSRSVEADHLVRTGWAHDLLPTRSAVRAVRIEIAGASDIDLARDPLARSTRMPRQAHDLIRDALAQGPVLVSTPRRGYAASLACERCRTPARCRACTGPLAQSSPTTPPTCRWCGIAEEAWACPTCGHRGLRAPVVGESRTAEELGRSFPGAAVRISGGDHVLTDVPDRPVIVVATPGAEPVAAAGYAGVVVLDTWLSLARADLRTDEEAVRRWSAAIALARPGGRAVIVGDATHPALQALVRWDPAGFAAREADERREAHLPPASRLATITGAASAIDDVLVLLDAPEGTEILGPVPIDPADPDTCRVVVRVPRARAAALSRALGAAQRGRAARKLDPVRIQVDPPSLD